MLQCFINKRINSNSVINVDFNVADSVKQN